MLADSAGGRASCSSTSSRSSPGPGRARHGQLEPGRHPAARGAPRRTRDRLGGRPGVRWRGGRRRSDARDHGGRHRRGRGARATGAGSDRGERRPRRRAGGGAHDEDREPGDRRPRARGGCGGDRPLGGRRARSAARPAGSAGRLGRLAHPPGAGNEDDRPGLRVPAGGSERCARTSRWRSRSQTSSGSSCPTCRAPTQIFDGLLARGDGDLDCAAVYTLRAPA